MHTTIKLSLLTTLLLNTHLIAGETLDEITVTSATKTSQKLSDVTSNINVITAQEIEERHYTTVNEALNALAGVSFTSNGGLGATSSIKIRGFDNSKVLVIVDGIRYNDISSSAGATFGHLMASDIESIEVLKGAQSGVWGADAAAGVINVITKGAKEGLNFHATQEFGSFKSLSTNVGGSYKNDNFYIKASHNVVDSDSFTSQAPEGEELDKFEDDGYNNKTSNLKAGFNITPTNKIDISHTVIDSQKSYDQSVYEGIFPNSTLNRTASANSQAVSHNKATLSSINFNHIDSFNEVDVYAKKSDFKRNNPQEFTSLYEGEVKEYGLKSKIPYLKESFVLWGGDYKKFEDKGSINKSFTNKAVFVTNYNKFNNVLGGDAIITESLRHDMYDEFDNETTGKIGLKYSPNYLKGFSTALNYGTAYNVPSSFQLYSFYGNPDMKPEITKGYDVNIAYKDLSLTYFNNEIEDIIDYDFSTKKYANVQEKSKLKGFEAEYSTTIADTVGLTLGYSKIDAKDHNGNDLQRRINESVKFALDYYATDDLHLGINGQYIGEREDTDFATYATVETGKYTVANFTANYEVDKHMSVYGKVDNITDKEYQTVYGYAASPRAVYAGIKLTY
ncbi:MAG: Outer membrane vitamin B12 receptor BtuB [uncultured Sulfurovum sp.]|uniref:Outer membrane vitamin B12 receptor BtuB n=1 Tax=uncultured Sulfurovum sp. TaxID=269237 RepID=A0A6S6RVY4_9BACT|nr:MAG: Outer membrane vitamin B12 receptor BtuB [uncultured Sulfurovum sp.]